MWPPNVFGPMGTRIDNASAGNDLVPPKSHDGTNGKRRTTASRSWAVVAVCPTYVTR